LTADIHAPNSSPVQNVRFQPGVAHKLFDAFSIGNSNGINLAGQDTEFNKFMKVSGIGD